MWDSCQSIRINMNVYVPFPVEVIIIQSQCDINWYMHLNCNATNAVHLEVVTDLTSEPGIIWLVRLSSRLGLPANPYSDCESCHHTKALSSTFHSFLMVRKITYSIKLHLKAAVYISMFRSRNTSLWTRWRAQ